MHQIVSFSLVFVDTDGKLLYEKAYCGENAGEYFFQTLDKIEENLLLSICKHKSPLSIQSLTDEENNISKVQQIVKFVILSLIKMID